MPGTKSLYTVKILSEEEFDRLPFKHAKTSLGAADPSTNIAYVRDTGYNDLTKDTIAHELDELMAKVSPHEEDGIRYKNLGSAFSGFSNAIGSIAKPVIKGVGTVAKAPFQLGASAIKGLTQPGGVFGRFGGGQSASIPTPAGASTATFPGFGQGPIPRAVNGLLPGGAAGTAGSGGLPTPAGGGQDFFQNIAKLFTGGGQQGQQQGGRQEGGSILDQFKNAAVPLAVSSLGNLFAPKVDTPDFSGVIDRLNDQVTGANGGASAIRQLGELRLTEGLNTDRGEPPTELFTQGDRISEERLADDLQNLERAFKAANPNVNLENNSAFLEARNEIVERERQLRGEQRDRVSAEFVQQNQQLRLQEIQTALNLDQAQVAQLVQLAQLEIAQIMAETGVSVGEAQQVKQLFGDLGSVLAQ